MPRPEREQQIVTAASLAFGTRGYAATNVADIARSAGISKPMVYHYFGSKEGLYATCLDAAGALLGDAIEGIARGESVGLQRGLLTLASMFEVLEDRRYVWRLLHDSTAPRDGRIAEVVSLHTERIDEIAHEGVSELLSLAGNTDELDTSATTSTWLGIVDSLMDWWVDHPEESAPDMTARVGRLLGALLASSTPYPGGVHPAAGDATEF